MITRIRAAAAGLRARAERTLVWQVWERLLENEFVDRSVALAGKAFVSFFPLVIVVAAFVPESSRKSIFTTLTRRLGVQGDSLRIAKEAFASSGDVRRATGILGLVLMFLFAASFTTALQRVYARAWRRPPFGRVGAYTRGPAWLIAFIAFMAVMGGVRTLFGDGVGVALFALLSVAATSTMWWFTAWLMLEGRVRWRVLFPTGVITGVAMSAFAISATIWMPDVVTRNEAQFGFFGVALALVTWFSGAAICVVVGACAGPVLAEDPGPLGTLIRGGESSLLVEGAPPSLAAPTRTMRFRDAFTPTPDDTGV